jgi:hypothetical protein
MSKTKELSTRAYVNRSRLFTEAPAFQHLPKLQRKRLYALGVGLEEDPLDEECFRIVIEEDLKVVPSQAVMMAHSGFWEKEDDIGIDWLKLVHAGQEIIVHKPMPTSGTVEATT